MCYSLEYADPACPMAMRLSAKMSRCSHCKLPSGHHPQSLLDRPYCRLSLFACLSKSALAASMRGNGQGAQNHCTVTVLLLFRVTVQVRPVILVLSHPEKPGPRLPLVVVAASVTTVPRVKLIGQELPQLIASRSPCCHSSHCSLSACYFLSCSPSGDLLSENPPAWFIKLPQ